MPHRVVPAFIVPFVPINIAATAAKEPCEISVVVLPLHWGLELQKCSLLAEDLASSNQIQLWELSIANPNSEIQTHWPELGNTFQMCGLKLNVFSTALWAKSPSALSAIAQPTSPYFRSSVRRSPMQNIAVYPRLQWRSVDPLVNFHVDPTIPRSPLHMVLNKIWTLPAWWTGGQTAAFASCPARNGRNFRPGNLY